MPDRELARRAFHEALLDDDAEQLYERAPCGYLSTTTDGVIIKANQTFLTLVGVTREELIGRRFSELLTPGGRIYHETHFAPMLHLQDTVREVALDIVRPDGVILPVLVNAGLERAGRAAVVRLALFDATERREYERELLRAKQRAEDSEGRATALARTLQQTLIPPAPPAIAGLEVAAVYRPAGDGREVGGDFYDVFQIADGDWAVVLGDVSGKGVEAAVITSLIRYSLRAIAVRLQDPAAALRELNDVVLAHESDRFCTVALLRVAPMDRGWKVSAAFAGHPPALVIASGGRPEPVGEPGPLLGVLEDVQYAATELALHPGDLLALYTDGVTEGRRGTEFFGEARLLDSLLSHGPHPRDLTLGLLEDLMAFQGGVARDDIAVLALRAPEAE